MVDLIHNATFRLLPSGASKSGFLAGIYRVILDEPSIGKTVTVLLQAETELPKRWHGGRVRNEVTKRKRKKPKALLVGDLKWMDRSELMRLREAGHIKKIEIEREMVGRSSEDDQKNYRVRCGAMASFLDFGKLRDSILAHQGISGLVQHAVSQAGVSRSLVYAQWSNICRYGFNEKSLLTRRDRSGAPGIARPCDLGGRKKAGRKTTKQRVARAHHVMLDPEQPGTSTEWIAAVRAADARIMIPKPDWPERCKLIINSAFCGKAKEVKGKFEYVAPAIGTYPNNRQIRRILEAIATKLQRLLEKTTRAHFNRELRGLIARNWRGVGGPGHTWAIDSTVGDIYLRSSIDRSWIVGRPIVYIIVDVWSTAVVGFFVCLCGPSWDMAKISLFNASADPALIGDLWGYQPLATLAPQPTLCYALLCDRGEYLSKGHRQTAMHLLPLTSYAMPYRPDLKGLVEVLHRIAKDGQYHVCPGAMDYRREELEKSKVNPDDCTMTVREYVQFLYQLFSVYNLIADRSHRLDAHMIAAGVTPSPSGLWSWGHCAGIGFRRHTLESDLIDTLLPSSKAFVGRSSVRYARCDYMSNEVQAAEWTARARNFGGWEIPVNYYPGSMSRIWTPSTSGQGFMRLDLSDESRVAPEATLDEWNDSLAFQAMKDPEIKHAQMVNGLEGLRKMNSIVTDSKRLTAEAIARAAGAASPTFSEARKAEVGSQTQTETHVAADSVADIKEQIVQNYYAEMQSVLQGLHADPSA